MLSAASGNSADWNKQTNYGVLTLTPYHHSHLVKRRYLRQLHFHLPRTTTFGNASTSQISATNSYLGTVLTGTWQGTTSSRRNLRRHRNQLFGLNRYRSNCFGHLERFFHFTTAFGGTGWNSIAAGYALFGNGAGALVPPVPVFYWDNTNSRLGIGTTTPNSKLTVFNNADDSAIEFSSASGSTYKWTMGMDYSDAGKFKIASSTALGTLDRFVINGNGYVGIGTSIASQKTGCRRFWQQQSAVEAFPRN